MVSQGGGVTPNNRVGQDNGMRLDHISYACTGSELADVVQRIGVDLGFTFVDGGRHPSFGTRNFTLPLADGAYIEVVSALDHPSALKAPFGQAVQQAANNGGGWMSWVLATDDISRAESVLGRKAAKGHRVRPDGVELHWRQLGVMDTMSHPQSPFFVQWESSADQHPSHGGQAGGIRVHKIEINCPTQDLGPLAPDLEKFDDLVTWIDDPENDQMGVSAVWFETPHGLVKID
ncbi:MAG: VOC family protein [Candidatus Nanopelagicales bacterium]